MSLFPSEKHRIVPVHFSRQAALFHTNLLQVLQEFLANTNFSSGFVFSSVVCTVDLFQFECSITY